MAASYAQQRLWLNDRLEGGGAAYNISRVVAIYGELDCGALAEAFDEVTRRHEVLRTTFIELDGVPMQVIAEARPGQVEFEAVVAPDLESALLKASQRAHEEMSLEFDLSVGPLLRVRLLTISPTERWLAIVIHHIICDAWSLDVMFRELGVLYGAYAAKDKSPLSEPEIQYADYADWQRRWLASSAFENQLSYWQKNLAGAPQVLNLPTDYLRPAVRTYRGASEREKLGRRLSKKLKRLSLEQGVTPYITLLAVFNILLSQYSGQTDIVIGSPIAGRNRLETEGLVGFLANTLLLRTDLAGNPSFSELLRRQREIALGAYTNQDVSFEKVVEVLKPGRDLSRAPLFQVAFTFQAEPKGELSLSNLVCKNLRFENSASKFDLTLIVEDGPDGLTAICKYATDLFKRSTVKRMLRHFTRLLEIVTTAPDRKVEGILPMSEAERRQILMGWNDTKADFNFNRPVSEMFEEQVERTPDASAVAFENNQITYAELNRQANRLAHYLRSLGVGAEDVVGVYLPPSLDMIMGLTAALKVGAAYLPLDSAYPRDRLIFMLEDARAAVLLTQTAMVDEIQPLPLKVVRLDAQQTEIARCSAVNMAGVVSPENLAYIIYTSGSTGVPKGVAVSHSSLANLICWHHRTYNPTTADRASQLAAVSFDASVWEIWPYLTSGASIYPANKLIRTDLDRLVDWLDQEAITMSFLPTVLAEAVFDNSRLSSLSLSALLTGGDKLQRRPCIDPPFIVVNHYGPTENTVVATFAPVEGGLRGVAAPPIGRPISNVKVFILNRQMQVVPAGMPGDLYLSGAGVARGYLGSPELTAERFLPHPLTREAGERLYRTGDLARYLEDGNLEFLGREDTQVKIRGYRIELGEIEGALLEHPLIRKVLACLHTHEPVDKVITVYVQSVDHRKPTPDELREFLRRKLPEYMAPAKFILLDEFPMTVNGKIDRKALPSPEFNGAKAENNAVTLLTPLEEILSGIWATSLGVERVGIHENFFELGGHSLTAAKVAAQTRDAFQVTVTLRNLFEEPTVSGFAGLIMKLIGEKKCNRPDEISHCRRSEFPSSVENLSDDEVDEWLRKCLPD